MLTKSWCHLPADKFREWYPSSYEPYQYNAICFKFSSYLLQMLCEECGCFLEIADIIRGFGLTILKGVMEVRDEKIWARFVVEVKC